MQISRSKTKVVTTIVMILLMASLTVLSFPVNAQNNLAAGIVPTNVKDGTSTALPSGVTPDLSIDTTAYLSFRPTVVGKGQDVLINMWITPALHVSRYIVGYVVTIQKPDGTTETKTLNSYRADTTAYFEFKPDQVGQYKLKFDNPGAYYPAGNYTINAGAFVSQTANAYTNFTQTCYYKPSSTGWQTLTVQEDMVASWPVVPLPTDYWTRPVQPDNREWSTILGDYPWYGPAKQANFPWDTTNPYTASQYRYTPYVTAPNSAHIAWIRTSSIGGMYGGDNGPWSSSSGGGTPSIIFMGRAYQVITKASPDAAGTASYLQCYDLRTGNIYFERQMFSGEASPSAIEYDPGHPEVPGAGDSPLGFAQALIGFNSGRLYKFSTVHGGMTANFSIAPLTTATYIMNGYALGVQTIGSGPSTTYRLINFTTFSSPYHSASDTVLNPASIISNITWPWSSIGTYDLQAGYTAQIASISPPSAGAYYGANIKIANMMTGQIICDKNDTATVYSGSCTVADHGKVAFLGMDGKYHAYTLSTGAVAWVGEAMDYPWSQPGFGAYSVQSAYGLIYREAYDGVYAFHWNDGSIAWHFAGPAATPFETPYIDENGTTTYSFNAGGLVADGKIFIYNTEHTASQPITRGWRIYAVNATTGAGIWSITGCMSPGPMADGYLTASNGYDGQMYVFGKGPSLTTVSAPQTAITANTPVIISGTVLDQSPGQPGKACVSKESMSTYMEYLHMQQPIDGIWHNITITGVPVSIDAIDPNGNAQHLGDATSDVSGTFAFQWTPTIAGQYKITATFMGDDSYGSSYGETAAIVVNAAPTATVTPNINPIVGATASDVMTYSMLAAVLVIVALAVVAVLIIRKR
jgi:hypothetical protein